MHKSNRSSRRAVRSFAAPLVAAIAIAGGLAPAAHAAVDSVGASATFTQGTLGVEAPESAVSFGNTQLDGRASYDLSGDVGNWRITDATGSLAGWTVTVEASEPTSASGAATGAVMTMKTPTAEGVGQAPNVAAGDAAGFIRLNTAGGAQVADAAAGKGVGAWDMLQSGGDDLKLVMPYNTRAEQYDSTITFTAAQGL
jgi:hypothetical protein